MTLLLLASGWAEPAWAQRAGIAPRLQVTLNDGWRYAPGPIEGAGAAAFDDSAWTRVDLPHTWNAQDAFQKDVDYRRGAGWYRKQWTPDAGLRGRRLFLYFEGANQVADVYVNGVPVGSHTGGYTAFAFEVTDRVRLGRPNVVAVRVDNRHDPDIPPLDADFTFYGGLYRDVWLVATAPVHVDVLDHASSGVYVDTPEVSADSAIVRVRARVTNDGDTPTSVVVTHTVVDADGRAVTAAHAQATIDPGTTSVIEARSEAVEQPHLWSPDDPYRYHVVTEVRTGDDVVDRVVNPLGFRWMALRGDGFHLNGKKYRLFGTNRHQDYEGLGNALPDDYHRRDVRLIKDTGFNFVRLAHYPQDPAVLAATDRLGLVVWEEVPVVNTITMSDAFAANAERMLVEMIRQHYNHPSVMLWGYMNEVLLRVPHPTPDGYYDAVVGLAQRLDATAHEEDGRRPTVTAVSLGEIDNGTGFQDVPDGLGMNLYFGWYYDTTDTLGTFLDAVHARHPDLPLFVSEYGAGSDERVHAGNPVAFDFSTEYAQRFHRSSFAQLFARPYLAGVAVWNVFDFGSATRQDTRNALNQKGLYRYDRTPKDVAFYYRAMLSDAPILHVERDHRHRAGSRPDDRRQRIQVFTNLPVVALALDGVSVDTDSTENGLAVFHVTLRDGWHHVEVRGESNGHLMTDAVTIGYDDRVGFFNGEGPSVTMAVNAGAAFSYVDGAGVVWEADRAFEAGSWGYTGGDATSTHHRIRGTEDDPLYQTARAGGAYAFDVPDGTYEVTLHFAELAPDEPAKRVFTVRMNDEPVIDDLDLAAEAGRYRTLTRKVRFDVEGGQGLRIDVGGASQGLVNGIQIVRQ